MVLVRFQGDPLMSTKEYQAQWHQDNKDRRLPILREQRTKRRASKKRFIRALKEAAGCADCKKDFPHFVLQLDHLRDKLFNISQFNRKDVGWARLQEELEKCEVVCANCHAARTWTRQHGRKVRR